MGRITIAVLVFLLLSGIALAQDQTTSGAIMSQPVRDPRAELLLQATYQAMGGAQAAQIVDTTAIVKLITYGEKGSSSTQSATIKTSGTNWRYQAADDGSLVIVNSTKGQAWVKSGDEQIPLSSLSVSPIGITHVPVLSALSDWANPAVKLEYLGVEQMETSKSHHVRIRRPLPKDIGLGDYDEPFDVYIDSQSMLVSRIVYRQRAPADLQITVPTEVTYSDYRLVFGILVPFSVRYSRDGEVISEHRVQTFLVNQGSSASDFELN